MAAKSYLVEIVPPFGYRIFRIEFSRRHIFLAVGLVLAAVATIGGGYARTLRHAEERVGQLRTLTQDQRVRLREIDARETELGSELSALREQNDRIRKLIGDGGTTKTTPSPAVDRHPGPQTYRSPASFASVAARIERLGSDSQRVRRDGDRLRTLALRVLNMHRLESIARARVLAAIPSLNPVGNADIASTFGWRAIPWPEFHKGVDLEADYGADVRAGAAGTVVAAGYDGGYGIKVEIDHGNGYRTWYCHLSRADVRPGEYVKKAQHIALVGSTGASTGPHLHYQIMHDGEAVDPVPYLAGVPQNVLASLK